MTVYWSPSQCAVTARSSNERIRIYKVVVHQVRIQKCIPFLYTSTVKKWDF